MVGSLVSLLLATSAQAASFRGLGDLPGGSFESRANGVSADGKVVVGVSASAKGTEAFRWTTETGMVGLGDLSDGNFSSVANGVSVDGTVIVGTGSKGAFRWTQKTGMASLGFLEATGVSADGTVVVGTGIDSGWRAPVRWTESDGPVSICQSTYAVGEGHGVSADGAVVVGRCQDEAFRWTVAIGVTFLPFLPGGGYSNWANGVSADGAVVVGKSPTNQPDLMRDGFEAFRWTKDQGTVGLGALLDVPAQPLSSAANAVSADGAVIVGRSNSAQGQQAFLWDEKNGMRSLRELLVAQGLDLTGWSLTAATAISADGRTVVGYGRNPAGQTEGWIATLESFSDFSAFHVMRLVIDQNRGSFFLGSNFTLGRDSNGINPVKEEVMLRIASATLTIPAGSFHKNSHPSFFAFAGQVDNIWIETLIKPVGSNRFAFQALAYGTPIGDIKNPITVELTIGDDSGTTTAQARSH